METKYQTELKNNRVIKPTTGQLAGCDFMLEPLTVEEIVNLEAIYNKGNQFPVSLRELLLLAGKYCYVLDYGINDTQVEMQELVREDLTHIGLNITTRPIFVIDVHRTENFLFVYLDEGVDDPMVYAVDPFYSGFPKIETIEIKMTLSSFINDRISELKRGCNRF